MKSLRFGATFIGLGLLLALAGGCQNQLHDENIKLYEQNNRLQADLTDARTKLADAEARLQKSPDPSQVTQMQSRIAELEEQLKQSQAAPATPGGVAPKPVADPALSGIEATYDKTRGTLTVNLPGEVLFESGMAALKPSAHVTLDKIAAAIKKDYSNKTIFVDGHTDTDPIVKTKNLFDDNWDLASNRANAVRKYLVSKGVDSKKIDLRAFGPNRPKATKPGSRRVEIVVQVN